jgi:hypothetical protein
MLFFWHWMQDWHYDYTSLVIELDVRESLSPSGSRRMACTQALGTLYVKHVQHILPVLKRGF